MKAQDLRDKTPDQLREELASLKKKRSTFAFNKRQVNWKAQHVCAQSSVTWPV